ncbi:MAG: S8 family peptidase, partial [Gaiellales bacterium]
SGNGAGKPGTGEGVTAAKPVPAKKPEKADTSPAGRYIITFPSNRTRDAFWARRGYLVRPNAVFGKAAHGFAVDLGQEYEACSQPSAHSNKPCRPPGQEIKELRRLEALDVLRVEPEQEVTLWGSRPAISSGQDRIDQTSLPLDGVINTSTDGSGVTAYIIDSGIAPGHGEFGGRVRSGYAAYADGNGTNDCEGHGTHVAGTVGGATMGVAPAVGLVAVRVVDCSGNGTLSDTLAALDWVVQDHQPGVPAVANLSLGTSLSQAFNDAARALVADGVTVVAAAGNDGADACNASPASAAEVVTVGAIDANDGRPAFSNFGPCVDLFAPGVDIISAAYDSATGMASGTGTSMASPHVAGAAALILSATPSLAPGDVAARLVGTATPGKVVDPGAGSPNLLLYAGTGAAPSAKPSNAGKGAGSQTGAAARARITWMKPVGRKVRLSLKGPKGVLFEVFRDGHLMMITRRRVVMIDRGTRHPAAFQVRTQSQSGRSRLSPKLFVQ